MAGALYYNAQASDKKISPQKDFSQPIFSWALYNRPAMNHPPIQQKLISVDQAVARIADDSTVACGGFIGAAHPEALSAGIERRFLSTGSPQRLTLVYAAGQGDAAARGLNHFGMCRC